MSVNPLNPFSLLPSSISAIKVALRLADGSLYSSPEGTETEAIDDTSQSCSYRS